VDTFSSGPKWPKLITIADKNTKQGVKTDIHDHDVETSCSVLISDGKPIQGLLPEMLRSTEELRGSKHTLRNRSHILELGITCADRIG
jgi:hypothetical protein